MGNQFAFNMVVLVGFFALMYFLLIRPQNKKDKQIKEMRNSLGVGDEVITIGGIKGKIVKTKDESLVIQVGADKVKFEIMRWGISQVVSKGRKGGQTTQETEEDDAPVTRRRSSPRRLKKAAAEKEEETAAEETSSEESKAPETSEDNTPEDKGTEESE